MPFKPEQADRSQTGSDLASVLTRAAEVAQTVVAATAAGVDRDAAWPEAGIRALLDANLGGLVVRREHGGLGYGLYATARVCYLIGRECASTALCFGMHLVGSAVMTAKATPVQQKRFLSPINAGRHLTTLALSEPGTGSHFYLPETSMRPDRTGWEVDGTKSFVTNGAKADSYVVSTVAPEAGGPIGRFSCVIIETGVPGMEWGPEWQGFGMRGNSSRTVALRGVRVPRENLLGSPGDQIWYVFEVVAPFFLMAMAGTYLGVAESALEQTRLHLMERTSAHTGAALSHNAVLQHRFGQLWSQVESVKQFVWHAAALGDTDPEAALPAILSAKAEVADCAVHVVNEAMTLSGGIAYRENSRLARCLRDVRAAHVMAPTTDLLRTWAGRALLGLPLLGD